MIKKEENIFGKLSDKEQFCLDAFLVNGNKELAYSLSRDRKLSGTDESIYQCQQRWMRSAPVMAYIERGKALNMNKATASTENGVPDIRDRDTLLRELNQLASSTNDTKVRADILCRIADIMQMKKQEEKPEEQQVKYYLPLPENEYIDYIQSKMKTDKAFANSIKKLTLED